MALQTRSEFAFQLGDGVNPSYVFKSTFERVYESLSQFGMVVPERFRNLHDVLQQVARIEIAGGQGVRLEVIQRHRYKKLKPQRLPNQKSDIFDEKLLQGNGSEPTQLREQDESPSNRGPRLKVSL